MKRFFRNNGLSLALLVLFLSFWAAQSVAGFHVFNDDRLLHGQPLILYGAYLASGHFWQATGENWESEFLQMGFYVILTSILFQKGSAESNDPDADELTRKRRKKPGTWLYRNSLSLAFLLLFLVSFAVHVSGGLKESNAERSEHGEPLETIGEFLSGSEFWFQSFQNWQSEFLAVLSIVVLSIFLRQHGSPESKKIDDPYSKTGGE